MLPTRIVVLKHSRFNTLKDLRVPYEIDLSLRKSGEIEYLASFSDATTRYKEAHRQTPAEHLRSCRKFAKSGLLPVAISVMYREGQGYESASIWHDRIAEL